MITKMKLWGITKVKTQMKLWGITKVITQMKLGDNTDETVWKTQ